MSGKKHEKAGGGPLQAGKKYSDLKSKQKKQITAWMLEETKAYYRRNYVFPSDQHLCAVIDRVYQRIAEAGIRIPYSEAAKQYRKRRADINKRVRRELNVDDTRRTEKVSFSNMCMVQDGAGNVLALDKVRGGYTGTTFPGGHLEEGETFFESVIREVREESGLEIRNPVFCGIYHWHKGGVHSVILLYRAAEFTGELKSSEEGEVYWIPLEEYRRKELAGGMQEVLKIVSDGEARECFMKLTDGEYQGMLY